MDASPIALSEMERDALAELANMGMHRAAATLRGSTKSSAPEVDIKALHAKIGELVLENDFLERALGKAGFPSAKR
jgi:transposase